MSQSSFKMVVPRSTLPLRWILLVPFLVQIVGTVSLVGVLSFRNGNAAVSDLATQLRQDAINRAQEHLKGYLEPPAAVVQSNAAAAELNQISIAQLETTRSYFAQQLDIYPSLDGIYLGDEEGRFLCICGASTGEPVEKLVWNTPERSVYAWERESGQRGEFRESHEYDPRQRPWYQQVQQSNQRSWSDVYSFTDGDLGITAAAPILDNAGRLLGVAGVDLRLAQIHQFLAQMDVSENAEVFVTDAAGLMIASSAERLVVRGQAASGESLSRLQATDSADEMVQATAKHLATLARAPRQQLQPAQPAQPNAQTALSHSSEFRWQGERHFVQTVPYQDDLGLDWRIVVVMPESDFMAQIHANTRTTLQLCGLALLLSTVGGVMLARLLSLPLQRASRAAIAVATGKFHHRLADSRIREVSLLSKAFERMAHQLQASFDALEAANSQLEDANAKLEAANIHLETRVEQRTAELAAEQEKSERLLLNILPASIAQQLKQSQEPIARSFDEVTILFADLVGFTPLAARYSATKLVELLNRLFCEFDAIADRYQLEKIKTIGDAYMVAAGLPQERKDHGSAIATMALEMQLVMNEFAHDLDSSLMLRIGINSGKVVGGVIGSKKFIYDVWGDAVNIASRMESSSKPGKIQVSEATYELLKDHGYALEKRGKVNIKGRGSMTTYWLQGRLSASKVPDEALVNEALGTFGEASEEVAGSEWIKSVSTLA